MKLITEYTQNQLSYSITEAKNGTKQTFIEGVFMQAENKNKNGRIYTREVLTEPLTSLSMSKLLQVVQLVN